MDRSREARRVSMAASNVLPRRRHRSSSSSLRDSPEDDGPVELQETARLRDRGTGKKDRDRERERDRVSSRSKRRRGDRMMHGSSNRDDAVGGLDGTSEESVNDDEDEDDDDGGSGGAAGNSSMRMLPPNQPSSLSSSFSNHHHHQHHHRKSFPPPTKVFRASPTPATTVASATTTTTTIAATPWKAPDEMIGVSVPRKARSASTKRSHECWASSGGGGGVGVTEQIHRQASTSPVRSSGGPPILASASPSTAPVSPSSSNASVKKKMKPNGPKQRPPKSSSKSTSSVQDEIEFEIAEVLYGMMRQPQVQVQGPTKLEIMASDSLKFDSRDLNNGSNNNSTCDAKIRSSPISNPTSTVLPPSSIPPTNSSFSATTMAATAPKRKRPRPVKYEDESPSIHPIRSSPISSATKAEVDHSTKTENSSPNLERSLGYPAENGGVSYDLSGNQAVQSSTEAQPELAKPENKSSLPDLKALAEESESRDVGPAKEEPRSPKKESPTRLRVDNDRESLTATKANSKVSEMESQREEKFQIDLMAPPPQVRSSPERDTEIDFVAVDSKPMVAEVETAMKSTVKGDEGDANLGKEDMNVEPEEKKAKMTVDVESQKPMVTKERNIDLQLDLEKTDRDTATPAPVSGNKMYQHVQKQQQQQQHPSSEKLAQSSSMHLPVPMASWPAGLPHMSIMAPLQGVVSMDGATMSPAALPPPQMLFNQPRPKRCATHCYIARNIHYLQQLAKINPYWQAAAGSAFQFGAKGFNMNVVPSTELHAGRVVNSVQDKALAIFPGHPGKDKNSQAAANVADPSQRKQVMLQQALPPGAPSNILHGPAFIFPLSQQAAAAASVRPGTMKSPPAAGSAASTSATSSASISATAPAVAGTTAMSFNCPNMPGSETQYLAIMQNGAYPIPIPAHVGAAPAYRGTHPQTMPFFNGSFYSSQMLHPSQIQQQPLPMQSQQTQAGHQNPSISSGSSSSQKHLQNQHQRPHGSGVNGGSGNLQGFPAPKNQPPQSLQLQQRQQSQNQNVPHQARQLESELGGEDGPSTADSRVSRANMSFHGQNFGMQLHPLNFALMTPASMVGASSANNNPSEKKQQQPQSQGSKAGIESLPSQSFAMSFPSINGATTVPGLDITSIAQNRALLSLPDAARHSYQFIAAAAVAQAAQQKKNYQGSEDGKTGGNDASNVEEERKGMTGGKSSATAGQTIAFSRPDLTETSISTMQGNTVIDSSARSLNLGSASARPSASVMSASISNVNSSAAQQQLQRSQQQQQLQQQQQQQQLQLQKQQQFVAAAAAFARSKTPAASNGSVYSDQMAAKFNVLPAYPQNLVQSSNSPAQSPQWKNSVRATTSQLSSPSLASNSSSIKNLPQQQARTQQGHTQISFAANPKPSTGLQGQPPPSSNQSPSSPMVVSSPTTSISKSAGGSPRTTSTSTSNKGGQSSGLSLQQTKGTPSLPTQKSSPVGGRNIPSILSHPHNTNSSSSSGSKSQLPQQQLQKHALQQAQMLYTNPYMQAHHAASSANTSPAGGFYLQRHRSEQQQQPQGSSSATLSLCPDVALANTSTTDPAKAAAAAAGNMKGGGGPAQGLIHAQFAAVQSSGKPHQLVPTSFSYAVPPAVPAAVLVKPANQKQPAGE